VTQIQLDWDLNAERSRRLLEFCTRRGAECFTATLWYWRKSQLEEANRRFFDKLPPHSLGKRTLENMTVFEGHERFESQECWSLNGDTIDLILSVFGGSLTDHEEGRTPENLAIYRGEMCFLGFISHEQYAFMRLGEDDLEEFGKLRLAFKRL